MDIQNHNWTYDDINALHDQLHNTLRANEGLYSAAQIEIKVQGENASMPFHLHVSREDKGGRVWADVQMKQSGIYEISPRSQLADTNVVHGPIVTATRDQASEMLVGMLLHPEVVFAHNMGSEAVPYRD